MPALYIEGKWMHSDGAGYWEIAVAMGKELSASRWFPFKLVAQTRGIDRDQDQVHLTGEMFVGSTTKLLNGG